ncbi:hypothetical protein [Dulcicalothrix desertica]|nr:hypothetical protein [Dulcicalothrix desertica]TWH44099.1 hypothetical protein CAL7102_07875 [Dulcicalothrix desertica PCC 7102]
MINRFVIVWGLISTLCMGLVVSGLLLNSISWRPADYNNILMSIAIYSIYWVLLAILQGAALFWKFQDKAVAYKWFFTTSITGFIVMFLHDFIILNVMKTDTRGQGVLILILSLPILALSGGFILGLAQLWLIRNRYKPNLETIPLNILWLFLGVISWVIGFAGMYFGSFFPLILLLYSVGSIIKGWFINKYLCSSLTN